MRARVTRALVGQRCLALGLWLGLAVAACGGGRRDDEQAANGAARSASPPSAPALPAIPQPISTSERLARITCAPAPQGGMLVTSGRSNAEVIAGLRGAIVVHRARGRAHVGGRAASCLSADGVVALTYPFAPTTVRAVNQVLPGRCEGFYFEPARLFLFDGEAAATTCAYGSGVGEWTCAMERPFAQRQPALSMSLPLAVYDRQLPLTQLQKENTYFAATYASGSLIAWASQQGQPARKRVLAESLAPSGAEVERIDIDATSGAQATIRLALRNGRALEIGMTQFGARIGDARWTQAPARPRPRVTFETRRDDRQSDSYIVEIDARGATHDVAGIDAAAAAFDPVYAPWNEESGVLVWTVGSEGATRIYASPYDLTAHAATRPMQVSTQNAVAMTPAVSSFAQRTVVTWSERNARGGTDVRATELHCE